jgi:hypothetical protein
MSDPLLQLEAHIESTPPPSERPATSVGLGQFNLFTGRSRAHSGGHASRSRQPEERWLFDPDFRLVLPQDAAGKEILVEEGICLELPGAGRAGYRTTGYR